MMNPEPLPEGVSIETTASPYRATSSFTGEGFKTPVENKPEGSDSMPCGAATVLGEPSSTFARRKIWSRGIRSRS